MQKRIADAAKIITGKTVTIKPQDLPKMYAHVVEETKQHKSWYGDYENSCVKFNYQDDYEFVSKLGRGRYSEVFKATNLLTNKEAVVKILKPVRHIKIRREVMILEQLTECPYIVQLQDQVCDPSTKTPSIITGFVESTDFKDLYPTLDRTDIQCIVLMILHGLDYAHSRGIVHRDIKPGNVMMHVATDKDMQKTRSVKIVDWGLADFYTPSKKFNCRVASRYFKGPELLLNNHYYDYSLDIWSLGCMFAGMVFAREPFFRGADNDDQLIKIAKVLGAEEIHKYVNKNEHITLSEYFKENLINYKKKEWTKYVNAQNEHLVCDQGLDLLSQMLRIDHTERPTAKDAISHPYFDNVRHLI